MAGLIVVAFVLVGGGAALAYFTSSGSGTGSARTGTLAPVAILNATAVPAHDLVPAGTADLSLRVDNPNSVPVKIVGISQDGAITVVGGTGCTAANSGVSVPNTIGLDIDVPQSQSADIDIPNGVAMTAASYSGCQGASFQIPVSVTVHQ